MMRHQPDHVDATFYVQVAPEWDRWGHDAAGNQILEDGAVRGRGR